MWLSSHTLTVFIASPDIRAEQALGVLRLAGPLERAGVRQTWWDETVNITEQVSQSDLIIIQRNFPGRREAYTQIVAAARQAGKPVIFEIDDLLWELPPEHPDRQRNIYADALFPMLQAATDANAITVASSALQDYCRVFHPNVWLLPNYLDERLWTLRAPRPPQEAKPITIGYMGGSSHTPDLESIQPVLLDLCQRYGSKLRLHFWGSQPPAALLSLPSTHWEPVNIVRYDEFAAYFSQQECDIWIAPLRPSTFNACKSAVKFLEYTATGVAGVYSRLTPYEQAVVHGETGMLAGSPEEWQVCLAQLIEEPQTRQEIAARAQQAVRQSWLLADHAVQWEQTYRQIVDSADKDHPVDKDHPADKDHLAGKDHPYAGVVAYSRPIPAALAARLTEHWGSVEVGTEAPIARSPDRPIARKVQPATKKQLPKNSVDSISKPQASIIVVTYNNIELTRQCLDSIFAKTGEPDYEVIVMDNASQDETPRVLLEYAATYPNLKVILNPVNEGFARGNNIGVMAASGDYLVFLNNDTVVTRGWLAGLIHHLQDPAVGMVGPVTNYSSNESRIAVDYDPALPGLEEMDAFAEKYIHQHAGQAFEVEMLLLLCVALRRTVYDEVGGIDERYGIGMFEDEDFAHEIRQKGYKLLCAEDVFIHHWGSASFSKLGLASYWLTFEENCKKFEAKWGQRWHPQLYRAELQREHLRQMVDGSLYLAKQVIDNGQIISRLQTAVIEKDENNKSLWEQVLGLDRYINDIHRSRSWRLATFLSHTRQILLPPNRLRTRIARLGWYGIRTWFVEGFGNLVHWTALKICRTRFARRIGRFCRDVLTRNKVIDRFYTGFTQNYPLYDKSKVVLYADASILPAYTPRHDLFIPDSGYSSVKVSLIATVRNEAANSKAWLDSLLLQSRLPDELVIVDGGSSDGTADIIREFARTSPFPIRVIEPGSVNISKGRNIAIENGAFPIIACTDLGCVLDHNWLKYLILPFEVDEDKDDPIEVSMGFYDASQDNVFARLSAVFFIPDISAVNPQSFIPSGRSVAMKKSLWAKVGGYPEFLTHSGEDTLFDFEAKSHPGRWAFVPQAKVTWHAPANFSRLYNTLYRYARGDGEMGVFAQQYWDKVKWLLGLYGVRLGLLIAAGLVIAFLKWWGLLLVIALFSTAAWQFIRRMRWACGHHRVGPKMALLFLLMPEVVNLAQVSGYIRGIRNRPKIVQRQIQPYVRQLNEIVEKHPDRKGIVVYPPTHDWGFMFQRPHQMARSFARRGYLYFFCTRNEKTDAVVGFQEVEPGLYVCHVPLETFKVLPAPIVYVGSPWGNTDLPKFDRPRVIYDHYDEIEIFSANPRDHQHLLKVAEIVLVTSQGLMDGVKARRPDALFVPNGADYSYIQNFRPQPGQEFPADWQLIAARGKPIIGYSGVLAEWVDYDLIRRLATIRTDLEFVLIGANYDGSLDRSGILRAGLANLHWLGMKSYDDLFRYVWQFHMGIIPFKINAITLSTTPNKLFEYMSCGKPVVSTALPECKRYPGVFIAETAGEFLEHLSNALQASKDENYLSTIGEVARRNTWSQRADDILARMRDTER
jgi:GT2 family glycosyltransferase/glycosyltransferase involved in cell wall biosynthesis